MTAIRRHLNMGDVLWQNKWVSKDIMGVQFVEKCFVAEPISDTYWPKTVEIGLQQCWHGEGLMQDLYALTATGYHNFAGLRIMFKRHFPWCVGIDWERRVVSKLSYNQVRDSSGSIAPPPYVKINNIVFLTNENIKSPRFTFDPLPRDLMFPVGVPPLLDEKY